MSRSHAFSLSVLLGLALAAGVFAVSRTVHLGASAQSASDRQLAAATRKLDASARAIRSAFAAATAPVPASGATPQAQPVAQRTVYVRPAPHVVTIHRAGGEAAGHEGSEGGGFGD